MSETASESNLLGSHPQRRPIVELLMLAAPTVAQMASYTFMQFADRWLLAGVGDVEAAVAGTAGITYFCMIGVGFGTLFIVSTFASQALGRGALRESGPYLWQGVWFGVLFGALTLLAMPFAGQIFALMRHEPRVVELEAVYFRVLMLSGWAKLAAMAVSQFLMGVHRPGIVFVATLLGVAVDFALSWVLIYGKFGLPATGVAGAAWGSNAGVLVELLVMGVFVFRPAFARVHHTWDWRPRWRQLRELARVGLPAGFQLVCDITAWMLFMNVIVGSLGTAALSANSFAFAYMHICFMPAFGVGSAVTALVGKYIGMGRPDLAERRAHLGFAVCAVYMVLAGLALFLLRFRLIGLFSADPQVQQIGATIMVFIALYQIFDAMFVVYVGALRGAGDTLVPAVVQAVLVWTIVVGGGAVIVHLAPRYGIAGPWTIATVFGAILGVYLLVRFRRGGWKQIRLDGGSAAADRSNVRNESDRLSASASAAEPSP